MREIEAARGNAAPQGTDAAGDGPAERQGAHAVASSRGGGRAVRALWAAGGFAAFGLGALGLEPFHNLTTDLGVHDEPHDFFSDLAINKACISTALLLSVAFSSCARRRSAPALRRALVRS